MNLILIEDEPLAAQELGTLLAQLRPDWTVLTTLQSIEEAIDWLAQHPQPDLIFSDIQLADGLSFQIFSAVTIHCPVIFCTAFDQYAIRAFEANGIDYLLKPIEQSRLAAAIKKYENFKQPIDKALSFRQLLDQLNRPAPPTTLLVYHRDAIIPLKIAELAFIHYEAGIVSATTVTNQRYILTQTLDELEKMLLPQQIFRANRQFMIHRQSILNAERYFGRKLIVRLSVSVPEPVIISKAKVTDFLNWLQH